VLRQSWASAAVTDVQGQGSWKHLTRSPAPLTSNSCFRAWPEDTLTTFTGISSRSQALCAADDHEKRQPAGFDALVSSFPLDP
jgi:hypothetical protein